MKKHEYVKNISIGTLENMCIIMVKETYSKTESGKSWKRKPDEIETKKVTAEFYYNSCDSIPFFKNIGGSEKAYFEYTMAGYLVTNIVSVSPDFTTKINRRFYIVSDEKTARDSYNLDF
jgi:hypothetical protein